MSVANNNIMNKLNHTEWWRRLANYVIDFVIVVLLLFLITFSFDKYNNVDGIRGFLRLLKFLDTLIILFVGVYFLYYLLLESFFGITIGKVITGTKVVDFQGNKPTFGKVLIRSLIRLIPLDWFTYFSNNPHGWHDSLSKTKVIKKNSGADKIGL